MPEKAACSLFKAGGFGCAFATAWNWCVSALPTAILFVSFIGGVLYIGHMILTIKRDLKKDD